MFIRALMVLGIKDKAGNGPIWPGSVAEVDDATGKRLVGLGHAAEVSVSATERPGKAPAAQTPNGNTPSGENAQETPKTGIPVDDENNTMDKAYLETLSFSELKEIAKSFGVYSGTMRSKESVIEALTSIPVSDDDDDLPDLTPQDVVEE